MTFNRCYIDSADFENSMRQRVKAYEAAFYYTLPLIRSFYEETKTYEQSIKMINTLLESSYYRLIQGNYLYLTKIFLQQYVSLGEENEKELRELFVNDNIRESFLKKFAQIPKDYIIVSNLLIIQSIIRYKHQKHFNQFTKSLLFCVILFYRFFLPLYLPL